MFLALVYYLTGLQKRKAMTATFLRTIRRRRWSRTARLLPEYYGIMGLSMPLTAATLHLNEERNQEQKQGVVGSVPGGAGEVLTDGGGSNNPRGVLNDEDDEDENGDNRGGRRPVRRANTVDGTGNVSGSGAGGDNDTPAPLARLNRVSSTLRLIEYKRDKDVVLGLCQERVSTTSSSVIVPWDQVSSVEVVTPSVLSICMVVHRYFGEDRGEKVFHPADVELFVTNCDARTLNSMIAERVKFTKIREEMKLILASGNIKCIPRTRTRTGRGRGRGKGLGKRTWSSSGGSKKETGAGAGTGGKTAGQLSVPADADAEDAGFDNDDEEEEPVSDQ
jgi:hypothetical protein